MERSSTTKLILISSPALTSVPRPFSGFSPLRVMTQPIVFLPSTDVSLETPEIAVIKAVSRLWTPFIAIPLCLSFLIA